MSTTATFIDENREGVTIVYAMTPWLIEPRMADVLTRHLNDLLDSGSGRILINLTDVSRLTSVFIRSFITAGKKAKELDAQLFFCSVAPVIRDVFTITGLDKIYKFYADERSALSEIGGE
ncbi:MAG: STAS domain-containing protein [Lentisphaerota bacterium]